MKCIKQLGCLLLSVLLVLGTAVPAEAKNTRNIKIYPSATTYYRGYDSKGKKVSEPISFKFKGKSCFTKKERAGSLYAILLNKSKRVVAQAEFNSKYMKEYGIPAGYLVPGVRMDYKKTKTFSTCFTGTAPAGTAYIRLEEESAKGLARIDKKITIRELYAPKSLKASASKRSVKISYKKSTGATKYEIYRADKGSSKFKKIATTSKSSYTDKKVKKGKAYTYKVRAIRSKSYYDQWGKKKTSTIRSAYTKPMTSGKVR